MIRRRAVLAAGAAAAVAGCARVPEIAGGFSGASEERGHLLRDRRAWPAPAVQRRTQVVIAGAGIAGLAAARALRRRGIEDFALLDLEDTAGGNSRGSRVGGVACPLGAHYLPVPGDDAREVQELLEELGLRRRVAGRWTYDERHLCHAPQERLFLEGQWQEGLLPLHGAGATTLAQYVRFAREVDAARRTGAFRIPLRRPAGLAPWDGETFAQWLDARGLCDERLRWYLDYCCRDDYGAGASVVSAAAGLHYFAARHGFHPPGFEGGDERDALLTWPQGNGFLAQALAAPLGERFHAGRVVLRVAEQRHGVELDAWNVRSQQVERWHAARCIVALPAFVAARVVEGASAVHDLAARTVHAPWVVANLHVRRAPRGGEGMPLAWDNVVYGQAGSLGYVVASHQDLDPRPRPTVLSWYCAPGLQARGEVLRQPWTHWRDRVLRELAGAHPRLRDLVTEVQVARFGHAMAVPIPGSLSRPAPLPSGGRLDFAHADWAGYSVFEEAFTLGHAAGQRA